MSSLLVNHEALPNTSLNCLTLKWNAAPYTGMHYTMGWTVSRRPPCGRRAGRQLAEQH